MPAHSGGGCDRDEATATGLGALEHRRDRRFRRAPHPGEVDVDVHGKRLLADLPARIATADDTRRSHRGVEATEGVDRGGDGGIELRLIAHVGHDPDRVLAAGRH